MKLSINEIEVKVFDRQSKGVERFSHNIEGELLNDVVNTGMNKHFKECETLIRNEILNNYAHAVAQTFVVDHLFLEVPLMIRL